MTALSIERAQAIVDEPLIEPRRLEGETITYQTSFGFRVVHEYPQETESAGGGVRAVVSDEPPARQELHQLVVDLSDEMAWKNLLLGRRGAKGAYSTPATGRPEYASQFAQELCEQGWNEDFFSGKNNRRDVLAPDANTGIAEMGIMTHTIANYLQNKYNLSEAHAYQQAGRVVASKPEEIGGIPTIREPATGYGLRATLALAQQLEIAPGLARKKKIDTVVIGAGGNVGRNFLGAELNSNGKALCYQAGRLSLVGYSEFYGSITGNDKVSLDITHALRVVHPSAARAESETRQDIIRQQLGRYATFTSLNDDPFAILDKKADVICLASPQRDIINEETVERMITAQKGESFVVLEGGNGSVSDTAFMRILEAGGTFIPGELANRWGSAVSNIEVTRDPRKDLSGKEVFKQLLQKQGNDMRTIREFMKRNGGMKDVRAALYAIALGGTTVQS